MSFHFTKVATLLAANGRKKKYPLLAGEEPKEFYTLNGVRYTTVLVVSYQVERHEPIIPRSA